METSMPSAVIFCKVMISTERYVSSWAIPEHDQLCQEIEENTWLIGSTGISSLMDEKGSAELWKNVLGQLGGKYEIWSRFPQIPTLN